LSDVGVTAFFFSGAKIHGGDERQMHSKCRISDIFQ
jgi:hypothetical protein